MFTKRFIKIPIKVYSIEQKELTGKENCEDTFMKLNPFEICYYHPSGIDDNDENFGCTKIDLKNGNSVICYLSIIDFENLLNGFIN